ncbi:MAG: hypothetical protein AAGA11_16175 [Pseudomonadota bacterium]
MRPTAQPDELIRHLCETSRLTRDEAERVVAEVLVYFDEPMAHFVQRRHRELQAVGLSNNTIFARILDELDHRRFPAPGLSTRQVRRLIYG